MPLALAVQQLGSALQESATWDEPLELAAGYSYWRTGDFRLNPEHPPLHKLAAAAPLLLFDLTLPNDDPSWRTKDQIAFSTKFLYENRLPATKILFLGRLPGILASVALVLFVLVWGRRLGSVPAISAAWLLAFDPNIIAHGHYVKNDVWLALTSLVACAAWIRCLREPSFKNRVLAGLGLGAALATKHSALLLLPCWFCTLFLLGLLRPGRRVVQHGLLSLVSAAAIGYLVLLSFYPTQLRLAVPMTRSVRTLSYPMTPMLRDANSASLPGKALVWIAARLGLPAHPYWVGVADVAAQSSNGRPSYILGAVSKQSHWFYFPLALLVKSTTGAVLTILAAILWGLSTCRIRRPGNFSSETDAAVIWIVLGSWFAVYLFAAMNSGLNLGVRHVLPIVPVLYLASTTILHRLAHSERPDRLRLYGLARGVVLALVAGETLLAYPYYLPFFNFASGGSSQGHHYFLDSNLDWGQDIIRLANYMQQRPKTAVCLAQFGNTPARYFGMAERPAPTREQWLAGEASDCLIAVSATYLFGLYVGEERFRWLRQIKPSAVIGYSIYVYDLRNRPIEPLTGESGTPGPHTPLTAVLTE